MPSAKQVAANLADILTQEQPKYSVDATSLTITIRGQSRKVPLVATQGQGRGLQAR